MKRIEEPISADVVLEQYLAASAAASTDVLAEWISRYPEYERELRELAAQQKMFDKMPPQECSTEEEEALTARAVSIVQNLLYQQRRDKEAATEAEPITDLLTEAKQKNFSIDSFAAATNLSRGLLRMMNKRQVRFGSIPREAIANIASALGRLISVVEAFLDAGMRLVPEHFKAKQAPVLDQVYEFSYLVEIDHELSQEQKQHWLARIPSEAGPKGDEAR